MEGKEILNNTDKTFDSLSEEEKKEWFKNLLEEVDNNETIKKLKDKWAKLTEDQKIRLYKVNAVSLSGYLKNNPMYRISSSMINGVKDTVQQWWKNAMTYWLLEHVPCRFLVELGVLDKPEWLDGKQLIKDVQKDAKNFNLYLWLCKAVCYVVPEAKFTVPYISMAKKYTKRYKKNCVPIIQERLRQKLSEETAKDIASALSSVEEDIVKTEVQETKN